MRTFAPQQKKQVPGGKPSSPSSVHEALRSSGKPLDRVTREHMESHFGHDFSRVRVHTDSRASDAAASIGARAFTVNHDIVFGIGNYTPHTESGCRLLAHELTHVVQQGTGVLLGGGSSQASNAFEQHANAVAALIAQEKPATSLLPPAGSSGQGALSSPGVLQMQEDPSKRKQPAAPFRLDLLPVTFKELDVNPARGAMQRAQMQAQQHATGRKVHSVDESRSTLFAALLGALERVDKSLTGDATQSWGLHLWGEGTSSTGSTATKATKDVTYLSSIAIDLEEVFEIMELLVLSVSKPEEMFTSPEDLKEKPAEVVLDVKQKLDAIEKTRDEEKKRKGAKEESRERSPQASELLQEIRELKQLVKVDLAKFKAAEGKPASPENKATATDKAAEKAPGEVKKANAAKPAWYERDPMGYWQSEPRFAMFEGISGDPWAAGGAVAVITDKKGTKRMFRYWFDKNDGYQHSQFLGNPTK